MDIYKHVERRIDSELSLYHTELCYDRGDGMKYGRAIHSSIPVAGRINKFLNSRRFFSSDK